MFKNPLLKKVFLFKLIFILNKIFEKIRMEKRKTKK